MSKRSREATIRNAFNIAAVEQSTQAAEHQSAIIHENASDFAERMGDYLLASLNNDDYPMLMTALRQIRIRNAALAEQ